MPFCVKCLKSLHCTCKTEQPIGEAVIGCPFTAKPGAIWVHVTDDAGRNLDGVPVRDYQNTNGVGLTGKELPEGQYTVALAKPSESPYGTAYDFPPELNKPDVPVRNGAISYVSFVLRRKAKLSARVVLKGTQEVLKEEVNISVRVTGPQNTDKAGPRAADFGQVSSGLYTLTPAFSGQDALKFDFDTAPKTAELLPGEEKIVDFEAEPKAQLKAEFVLLSDPNKKFIKPGIKVKADYTGSYNPPNAFTDAKDGIAGIGLVSAGKYVLTPDYTGLADKDQFILDNVAQTVTLASNDVETVTFTIELKAHLKVEVFLKPHLYYKGPKHLEEVVTINALLDGAKAPLTADTNKGIADLGWVKPGKYTITPDYSKLKECEYDWNPDDKKEVELQPAESKTEQFEVEPLYQEVQFIAHCLLTIPDMVFDASAEDKQILDSNVGLDGKKTCTLKPKWKPKGMWTPAEVKPEYAKAEYKRNAQTKTYTLIFKKKRTATGKLSNDYYTLNDLDTSIFTDPSGKKKVQLGTRIGNTDPEEYPVEFLPVMVEEPSDISELTGQWKMTYHGHPNDQDDIKARIAFIKDTLQKAAAKAEQDPTILKVFMIPECFFQGIYGAYLEKDTNYLITELQKLVEGEEWKDWVFSFGTINTVFEAPALGTNSFNYARTIYEMINRGPVIRGGVKAAGADDILSTRLVRKVLNSAELADDLIPDKNATARDQAINQDVQFKLAGDEDEPATLFAELIRREETDGAPGNLFQSAGLPVEWWQDLWSEMKISLGNWGVARVVREIRLSDNEAADAIPLKGWMYTAYDASPREPKTCLLTLEEAILLLIQAQWRKLYGKDLLTKMTWDDDTSGKRVAVLSGIGADFDNVASKCGFRMQYQKDPLKAKIAELIQDPGAAKALLPDQKGSFCFLFRPTMFPLWKKLLKLYAEAQLKAPSLTYSNKILKLEDYCFAGPRKPGPWFRTLAEAKPVKACKRLVFGLEICADHANQRLGAVNSGADAIEIDVQLVPSAGMAPGYFATRTGGYLFNCDGWNKQPTKGGKSIGPIALDGFAEFIFRNEDGYSVDVSPVHPHSAVAKRETDDQTTAGSSCWTPKDQPLKSDPSSSDLSKVIFGYGPGELHFYEKGKLPQ